MRGLFLKAANLSTEKTLQLGLKDAVAVVPLQTKFPVLNTHRCIALHCRLCIIQSSSVALDCITLSMFILQVCGGVLCQLL